MTLASFSSAGPTAEGFVKPDVVAPGGHMLSMMPSSSSIAVQRDGGQHLVPQE
jgi:serine protease AprX